MNSLSSSQLNNIQVIIPVRNEAKTIGKIIQKLQSLGLTRVRVVDNGSRDGSGSVAINYGAELVTEPIAGYGQACWTGLQDLPPEVEWLLFCDGDGSDDLGSLPQWFELKARYDLILGDRRATPPGRAVMTPVQRFGNVLATNLISWGWGYKYSDLGPMRLIRRQSLAKISMCDRGFGWTVEMQVRALELNLRIAELPVGYFPRQGGKSKISGTVRGSLQAGTIILTTLGKLYYQKFPGINTGLVAISGLLIFLGAMWLIPYGDLGKPRIYQPFWLGMGVMNLGFMLSWGVKKINWWWFWGIAIASRIALLFMYPGNDIWRYLWEGYIQLQGFSPYDYAPNAVELATYKTSWWWKINHLDVSAIYPPLTQLGFKLLASLSPSVILFKSAFVAADLMICFLLVSSFGRLRTLTYAWNPIILYSFAGGGHYDSWFVLPLVIALYLLLESPPRVVSAIRLVMAACCIGISIAIKWISLPILGFLMWRGYRKSGYQLALIICGLGIAPFMISSLAFCATSSCQLIPTSSSFVIYGRYTEFIPFFLAKAWAFSQTTNFIFAIPLGLGTIWLILTKRSYYSFAQAYFVLLLIISPIVHFWYFSWIVPFGVVRQNWGIRFLSISSLCYFILPLHQASRAGIYQLTTTETLTLWLPFIFGYFYSSYFAARKQSTS